MPALSLLLWAVRRWCFPAGRPLLVRNTLEVGLLLGLCVATRINFLVVVPALLLASLLGPFEAKRRLAHACLASAVAAVVLAANLALLVSLTHVGAAANAESAQSAWGLRGLLSALRPDASTAKAMVVQGFFPLGFVAVAALVALPRLMKERAKSADAEAIGLLLLFGLGLLCAWLLSPRGLYRYVLPAFVTMLAGLVLFGLRVLKGARLRVRHGAMLIASAWALGQLAGEASRTVRIALTWCEQRRNPLVLQRTLHRGTVLTRGAPGRVVDDRVPAVTPERRNDRLHRSGCTRHDLLHRTRRADRSHVPRWAAGRGSCVHPAAPRAGPGSDTE